MRVPISENDTELVPPAQMVGHPGGLVDLFIRKSRQEQSDRTRSWAVVEIVSGSTRMPWVV